MGVLNVTPDSFYDGGALFSGAQLNLDLAIQKAAQLVEEGADFIDVGGESTRPGAAPVGASEECDRVLPVVEAIVRRFDVVVSVDTSTPQLMREAAGAGAGLINDVRALERPGALEAAAASGMAVCLMHRQGEPGTMQDNPEYHDVCAEVESYLVSQVSRCEAAGLTKHRLIVDPGIGFGKTDAHNFTLLQNTSRLRALGMPVLIGVSRKSLLGRLLQREPAFRLAGSLALAYDALMRGASILRVHDVAETRDVVTVYQRMMQNKDVTERT